jgi:hypothetical protein
MKHSIGTKISAYAIIVLALLFMFGVCVSIAHGEATNPRPNSLGVSETYQNPNTYLFGLPIEGTVLDEQYTRVIFKPYAAPALYTTTILFCGNALNSFTNKPMVIVFRTQASGKYQGVGCHELVGAFEVTE